MGLFSGPRDARASAALAARAGDGSLFGIGSWADMIPLRSAQTGAVPVVTPDAALRNSAVWACLRLRADLVSTLPVDVFRRIFPAGGPVEGIQIEAPKPPVLVTPGGERIRMIEWLWASQFELDRSGNTIGIIDMRDGNGFPARIRLQPIASCSVLTKEGELVAYRIGSKTYDPYDIWHEKQFPVPGLHMGLSPIAYAALMLGRWSSIQAFAQNWFGGKGIPAARLRNTAKTLNHKEALRVKEAWSASVAAGEPFVHGADWEYAMLQGESSGNEWLEAEKASVLDVARYFGCPGDLIEAVVSSGSRITYANITQRHLGFLVTHLDPAVTRREDALTTLTQKPRYVKLNRDKFLAMDPVTRAQAIAAQIAGRYLAPSEARSLNDRPPFTDAQIAEFDRFWPAKPAPAPAVPPLPGGGGSGPSE